MSVLYRIVNKFSGVPIADLLIESSDAILLSDEYELITTEDMILSLEDLKELYIKEVNKITAKVRSRFITLELGQETTYIRKSMEALAYIQAVEPIDLDYPYMNEEAIATETTVALLAPAILQKSQEMDSVNKVIEAQRKRGVKKINEAVTEAEAKVERDGAFTALDAHGGA